MRYSRQNKILEIINNYEVETQEKLASLLKESGYDVTQELAELKLLDDVEIIQGQLKGLKGTVVLIQNTNFVQIQLKSLQQNIKVKLPIHILKNVSLQ